MTNCDQTISFTNQRRKSSPDCLYKSVTPPLIPIKKQKDEKNSWLQTGKQSFKDVLFHHHNNVKNLSLSNNNNNKTVTTNHSFPPSPPHTPFLVDNTNPRLERTTSHPFSSISSNSSYLSYSSLPAAPVLSGTTSIKKKKKRLPLRASITSDSLFVNPTITPSSSSEKMIMMMSSNSINSMDTNNTDNRNSFTSDIELATEIGQGLLSEVRRMQSVLQERQESLSSLEVEKTENQQRISELLQQLRYKTQVEERLNEAIWNLELTKQDLSHQIRQLSQSMARAQMEQVKRDRQSMLLQQELDSLKTSQVNWQDMMNKAQADYEATLSNLNNQLIKLKKEKDEITSQLEELSKAQKIAKEEEIQEGNRLKKLHEQEIESLQTSLLDAHTVVKSLQLDLENEKQKKDELDTLLRESQETIESMQSQHQKNVSTSVASSWCQESSVSATSLEQELESAENRSTAVAVAMAEAEKYGSLTAAKNSTTDTSRTTNSSDLTTLDTSYQEFTHPNGFDKVLPCVMHTMIGEWLFKFTRNRVGHGISNKSHQRFFWLHPYTKTLYWSEHAPGTKSGEFKAKSVSIESFHLEKNHHRQPIIVIKSSSRDIQIQCIHEGSQDKWVQSLNDLFKDEAAAPLDSPPPSPPQQRPVNTSTLTGKKKRFSMLLESAPPSTVRKQKWRLSGVNLESSRFSSLR